MRIRQIKPDFWSDELMAEQSDAVRLFYIGLWQEADDGGWMRWSVAEIARDLYGYQPRGRRERWVTERGAALAAIGRLHLHECGHAFLPTLTKHQKFGGRPVHTVRDAHARDCARMRANDRPGKEKVEVGKGKGGYGGDEQPDEPTVDALRLAIDQNRAILDDPKASDAVKRAARKFLMSVGELAA